MITWNSYYNIMNKIFICLICILLVSAPFTSSAAGPGGGSGGSTTTTSTAATEGITKVFCKVIKVMTGDFSKVLSMIVAIFVGGMLLFGKLQWMIAVTIIIALGLLFSAEKMGQFLSGGGDVCADHTE